MDSKFERWIPIENLPNVLYISSIIDDKDGFRILMENESEPLKRYEVIFNHFYGYRNFDESERLQFLPGITDLKAQWSLFKGGNTDFAKWLSSESLGIVKIADVEHYLILTPNDILEILSSEPPSFREIL